MNDVPREIDRIEKRTRRYWFDDGLAEIAAGSGFLLVALSMLVARAFEARIGRLVNLVFALAVLVVVFAAKRIVITAKDRYVHPRTGYVSYGRPRGPRVANALAGAVLAALLALAASRAQALHNWIPAVLGFVLAIGFLVVGRSAGALRFPLEGISCAVFGVLLSMLRLNVDVAAALVFTWIGLVLVMGGGTAFLVFTRHAPPADGRSGDGAGEEA